MHISYSYMQLGHKLLEIIISDGCEFSLIILICSQEVKCKKGAICLR
jgi:hypothetical protein